MENTTENELTPKQVNNQHKTTAHVVLTKYLESFGKKKRATPEREIILDIIYNTENLITITDIESKAKARNSKLAQSGVYKILNFLMDLDLIVEIAKSKGVPVSYAPTIGRTHGIILKCMDCKKLTTYTDDRITLIYKHIEETTHQIPVQNSTIISTRCQQLNTEAGCSNK